MGTCWPKPVNNLSSTTKFSRPANDNSKVRNNKNHPNNNDTHQIGRLSAADPNRNLGREGGGGGGDGGGKDVPPSGKIITPNLKMFTLAQLQFATRNFRPDSVLGEGGFGTVYKGWIDEKTYAPSKVDVGMPVAVKKSNPDSEQGLKEWQAEVKFLGKFSHPNLVKLLGYCWEDKHFLLVYEYMQKGSLETHLFRKDAAEPFSWDTRMKIALGAACGLAFLHTTEKQVIYRDFKAANILLDRELNAKLSDFGLAKLGPVDGKSHVTTNIVGTYGYAAPEYLATGHLYLKSDVYGFGVVLLEIITGKRVLDPNRPNGQINLVDWARPFLFDIKKSRKIMDPRLENKYPSKAAFQITQLILKCIDSDQKCRPGMEEVLETLKRISTIKTKPKECKIKPRRDQQPGNHQHFHTTPRHVHHGGGRASRAGPCDNVIAAGPGFIDRFG